MDVTYAIFENLLQKEFSVRHNGKWNGKPVISNIMIGCPNFPSSKKASGELFLISEEMFDAIPAATKPVSQNILVILGRSGYEKNVGTEGFFLHAEGLSFFQTANRILALFWGVKEWAHAVTETAGMTNDMETLLQLGTRFLKHDCCIINAAYRIEYVTGNNSEAESWVQLNLTDEENNSNMVEEAYLSNRNFEKTFLTSGLQYFENQRSQDLNCYYYNMFDHSIYLGRLLISVKKPVEAAEQQLLSFFAQNVSICYAKCKRFSEQVFSDKLHKEFLNLLNGDAQNHREIETELAKNGWGTQNYFQIIILSSVGDVHERSTLSFFCGLLERDMPSLLAVVRGEHIVCIYNKGSQKRSELLPTALPYFLRDNLFKAGISCTFSDFFNAPLYEKEAEYALSHGAQDPNIWLHRFEDCSLDYCLEQVQHSVPGWDLVSPVLKKLSAYDRKYHEVQLLKTLYTYMQNRYNASKTAEKLHIHRTTLLYRLSKMQEICPFDLRDMPTRLHILLSYAIDHDQLFSDQ